MNKTFAVYIDTITARFCSKGDIFAICDTDGSQFNTKILQIIRDENDNKTILIVEPFGEIPPDVKQDVISVESFKDSGCMLSLDLLELVEKNEKKI